MSAPQNNDRITAALDRLRRLHPRKIDLDLGRIERVLKLLGHPEQKLPPTIHVAGTNGKGSTIAFLRAIAQAQGLKTHIYTSPHLVHFNERIVLAGQMIDDDSLADVLGRVSRANGDHPLTFFEATTAAAFLAFSETPADLLLLEVGLGGRVDATNVITPALSLISPIDYDHAEFLGRDLATIAREKAGIMKRHMPVIIGRQSELVKAVLDGEARKHGAPASFWGEHYRAYMQHGRMVFEDDDSFMDLPAPNLIGPHQVQNAALAIAAAKRLQIADKAIAAGLSAAHWPARLQPLTHGPLYDMTQKAGAELWLDGGHNPHAANVVAAAMADLEAKDSRPLILIMGILANKDAGGYLDEFEGLAAQIIALDIDGHSALAPETLCEIAAMRSISGQIANSVSEAVQRALNMSAGLATHNHDDEAPAAPRILICGSLYLAGQVLALKDDKEQDDK